MNKYLKFGLITALTLLFSYGVIRLASYKYVQPDEIGIYMVNGGYNGIPDYKLWQGSFPFDFTPATKSFILPSFENPLELFSYKYFYDNHNHNHKYDRVFHNGAFLNSYVLF